MWGCYLVIQDYHVGRDWESRGVQTCFVGLYAVREREALLCIPDILGMFEEVGIHTFVFEVFLNCGEV
jgi:hypothetical protein